MARVIGPCSTLSMMKVKESDGSTKRNLKEWAWGEHAPPSQ